MHELVESLSRYLPVDAGLGARLERLARPASFARLAHVFEPGEPCRQLFYMVTGLVRSYYVFGDKEVNLRLLCDESAVLPLSSYITGAPSFESIQCLEPCRGYWLPLPTGDGAGGFETLRRVLAERHYLAMERRLLTLQYKTARERYRHFRETMEPKIVARTPALHVASYLGVRPESLSRLRRDS
ncbi:MAG TPA: hypothetical protein VJM11_09025 [Nevskiaceae bacterium]|nr:hypothetical protein [Nevskiaceae bacterium]